MNLGSARLSRILTTVCLVALAAVLTAWSAPASAKTTRTVTDSVGRQVTFNYPPKRLILTDDTIADPVLLFRKQRLVVGVENSVSERGYFPVMGQTPKIGNQWRSLNWEMILSLKPDLILLPHHPAVTPRVTAEAARLNLPLAAVQWHYPKQMAAAVELLGRIFGEEKRAAEFLKWRQDRIDLIRDRLRSIPEKDRRTAYVEVDVSGPVGRSAGKGMPADQTLELAGLINVCQFNWSKKVSSEWLLARNPDLIVMNDYGGAGEITGYQVKGEERLKAYLKELKARAKFRDVTAVAQGRVFIMNSKIRGAMHMVGALFLAKAAYPEVFRDIDPQKDLEEFFERWLETPYKGIWFYPRPGQQ